MSNQWLPKTWMFLVFLVAIGVPVTAEANAGTPLIWATLSHLFLGNLLIGICEGHLLSRYYRALSGRTIGLMILANYFSAWVGILVLEKWAQSQPQVDLQNVLVLQMQAYAMAYIITLALEWPFVFGAFLASGQDPRHSVRASFLVQSASYLLLIGWYFLASETSLVTKTTLVSRERLSLPTSVRLYYIAEADGNVYTQYLAGGPVEKVFDLNSKHKGDCLAWRPVEGDPTQSELIALSPREDYISVANVPIGIFRATEDCPKYADGQALEQIVFHRPGTMKANQLGDPKQANWSFRTGFWALQGLIAEKNGVSIGFRLSLEVPFFRWTIRHACALPGDHAVFVLDNRQICLLDPESQQIALLCRGRGVVPVFDERP